MKRVTFLTEFVIVLAVSVAAAFSWQLGVLQAIWRSDDSYMTSAIAALLVLTIAYTLASVWRIESRQPLPDFRKVARFGHWVEKAMPMLGLLGTVIGISLQAAAKSAGTESLDALKTGLFASGCGMAASLVVSYMTHILED